MSVCHKRTGFQEGMEGGRGTGTSFSEAFPSLLPRTILSIFLHQWVHTDFTVSLSHLFSLSGLLGNLPPTAGLVCEHLRNFLNFPPPPQPNPSLSPCFVGLFYPSRFVHCRLFLQHVFYFLCYFPRSLSFPAAQFSLVRPFESLSLTPEFSRHVLLKSAGGSFLEEGLNFTLSPLPSLLNVQPPF